MREGTRQKWKSLGLSDSDGSNDDERLRESGKKPDKSESVGGGLNFYCDMISPSPSSRDGIQFCREFHGIDLR